MDAEKLKDALVEKMSAEQDKYRAHLLTQSPEEILNHTNEYTTREDILMAMEFAELTEAQVNALLKSTTPLADVYKNWSNMEFNLMDNIVSAIEDRADTVIRQEEELYKSPVYKYPGDYARENGELEQFCASLKANLACADRSGDGRETSEGCPAEISRHPVGAGSDRAENGPAGDYQYGGIPT